MIKLTFKDGHNETHSRQRLERGVRLTVDMLESMVRSTFTLEKDQPFALSYIDADGDTCQLQSQAELDHFVIEAVQKDGRARCKLCIQVTKSDNSECKRGPLFAHLLKEGKQDELDEGINKLVQRLESIIKGEKQDIKIQELFSEEFLPNVVRENLEPAIQRLVTRFVDLLGQDKNTEYVTVFQPHAPEPSADEAAAIQPKAPEDVSV